MTLGASLRRRLDPGDRYGLRLTLVAVAFLVVAIPFGWLVSQVNHSSRLVRIDGWAARSLHGWVTGSPGTVRALEALTFFGSPVWFYVVVVPCALVLWRRRHRRLAIFLVTTTFLGGVLDTAVKFAVGRERPVFADPVATAHGRSFPSGHAMSSVVVYGSLLLVFLPWLARRWRPVVIGGVASLVLAIGFSRLALGVHFLSDVIGGFLLGLAWLAAATAVFSTWRVDRGRPPVDPGQGLEPESAHGSPAPR